MRDARKLTVYFGERDLAGDGFLADRIMDAFAAERVAASVLLRGVEGFGAKQRRRTDRLLSLSEDLPLVALAIDAPAVIERVAGVIGGLRFDGPVTVERARMGALADPLDDLASVADEVKLTAYIGRGVRHRGAPAYETALAALHLAGVSGATALAGVDGTLAGRRGRARFWSRNVLTPSMVVSVGSPGSLRAAAAVFGELATAGLVTAERVRVLKRDGVRLADLPAVERSAAADADPWIKLTLYSAEQNHFEGRPVHIEAIERLRAAGASGATALRGVWGYHGDHAPHGDSFWSLRRRVPTVTAVVDTPQACRRWLELLDEVTPRRGLITSEIVPRRGLT